MNIIDFAIQMELDGMTFYEKSAQQTDQPELAKVLRILADEEKRHYNVFKRMKGASSEEARREYESSSPGLSATRNIFHDLVEQRKYSSMGSGAREIWTTALKLEEQSEKLYREESAKETDATRKFLLDKIADEERNHIYLVDNMLSFMADPQGFSDSADFKNFKSWEGK
jgi:rubrerythrin